MIAIVSPAKTLDFSPYEIDTLSTPRLLEHSDRLVNILRKKRVKSLMQLMDISENLAAENYERFQAYAPPFTMENAKPAVLAFKGDVYLGLDADSFTAEELAYAQNHLRILSGLYGLLRPLDLIQAYRLEMGTALKNRRGKNLYEFWGKRITKLLQEDLAAGNHEYLINLASKEYFKSIQPALLGVPVINIHFKERRNGKLKVISFNAKKARGTMARALITERIKQVDDLQDLSINGYVYEASESNATEWTYILSE